jgi:uncharacterized pyridoxamine 5'-phosphate oxidase family protein
MGKEESVDLVTRYSNSYCCDDTISKTCKQWNILNYIETQTTGTMFVSRMKMKDNKLKIKSAKKDFLLLETNWKIEIQFFSDKAMLFIIQENPILENVYSLDINIFIVHKHETDIKTIYTNTTHNGSRIDLIQISEEILSHSFEVVDNKKEIVYLLGFIIDIEINNVAYPLSYHFPQPHEK